MKTKLTLAALTLTAAAALAADVPALWDKHCVACHAKDGSGNTKMGKKVEAKDYRDPKVQEAMKEIDAIKSVKNGLKQKGVERMKPFADKLTDEEIKALIAHMRTFKK
jgi:cytochrome c553